MVEEYLVSGRVQLPIFSARDWLVHRRLITYGSFVRFSHSVFALPLCAAGALLAVHRNGEWGVATLMPRIVGSSSQVAARIAAMGFNRLVDALIHAQNPRTAARELPRG